MLEPYHPSQKILEKYADVLVNFALNSGKGIKKGETVMVNASDYSKRLYAEILKAIWKAGGNVISRYSPSVEPGLNIDRMFYEYAKDAQIHHFPQKYMRGLVEEADHQIMIIDDTDKQALKGIAPEKLMSRGVVLRPYMEWRTEKENKGKFTWTLALYGTPAMAHEAKMSLPDYWKQIISACFLNEPHPIALWKKMYRDLEKTRTKLNSLKIDRLHIQGDDVDLTIKLGENRKWMGGSGRNIPSFELFTSPDWRGTEGWIKFNQPLYRYGNLIEGIELEFKNGCVVKSKAKKNEQVLKSMLASPNADKVGEFSLTDKRFSRITKFMAETLYDENMGGPYGNTHIAVGNSYHDCFTGDPGNVTKKQWEKWGYNNSAVHTDMISTTARTVTAYLIDGTQKVIYTNGQFTL